MVVVPKSQPKDISLYFHIPFCRKKCGYCHFYVLPDKEELKELLDEGFSLEWELKKHLLTGFNLKSIYFGGGTPYLFGPERVKKVLQRVETVFGNLDCIEITIEANPESIDLETLKKFRKAGVNRLSLGIQSLSGSELITLTRDHPKKEALNAPLLAYEAGFTNISIDLMYDVPGQSLQSFDNSLKEALKLPITHISLYNLTFEPGTVFFKNQNELKKSLPSEESSHKMVLLAIKRFEEASFHQYEVSAFAKDGLYSVHNTGYWTARPFLGFGPSAFSYYEGSRFRNIAHLNRYIEKIRAGEDSRDFEESLKTESKTRELILIGLRLNQGVCIEHLKLFGCHVSPALLSEIETLVDNGFLISTGTHLKLTSKGRLFFDTVGAQLV